MKTITKLININKSYSEARLPEVSMSYDIAVKIIEEQNELEFGSWHYLIRAGENYHFYMDVDNHYGKSIETILDNVVDYFQLQKTHIKISKNRFKDFSFHIDIPSIYGTPAAIHSHIKCIAEKYKWSNTTGKYQWDNSVYPEKDATRLYRMPNQSKPAANDKPFQAEAKHEILLGGQTIDFILDYYYDDARLLESFSPTVPTALPSVKKQNVACNDDDLSKIIDCLSVERATDYTSWRLVGFALRNIEKELNENLHHFLSFSEKGEVFYPKSDITKRYISFKPEDKSNLKNLIDWAKEDNMELYKQYFPTKCLLDDDNETTYPFTEWEKTHCKILNPASYMEHKIDNDQETFILRNTKGLENSFNHLSIDLKTTNKKGEDVIKKGSFIKAWINLNDKIKIYDQIGMFPAPLKCPNNIYNCWSSFRGDLLPSASEHPNELATFKKLLSVLCGHEQTSVDYFEKWIAQAIQYPAHKTTVPTIISKQGAGKGTLIKLLAAILGQNKVLSTTNADVVFGKFNNQMLDAYLVNLDELSPKDVKDVEHKVKGLITEPTISIDIKGVSSITIRSYHRFINTTNSEFGVFKTEAGDRRNFIVRASDELIGNKQFFTDFNENIINNNSVVKYIYDHLKGIPGLDKFHEAGNIPSTSYGEELKQASRNDYDLWLEDFTKRNKQGSNTTFSSKYLFEDFTKFVKKDGVFKSQSFGIRILNIVPNAISKGKHSRDGETKVFNWDILKTYYKTECLIDEDDTIQYNNVNSLIDELDK